MRIIEIIGETPKTRQYDKCVFIITNDGEIWSEDKILGFCRRTDTTKIRLREHIANLKNEGFTINDFCL